MSKTPEGEVVKACLEYLGLCRVFAWRNNSGALPDKTGRLVRYGKVGSSDIIGCLPGGRFLAVECKAGPGRATEAQSEFLEQVRSQGGLPLLVRSMDELRRGLREAGYPFP